MGVGGGWLAYCREEMCRNGLPCRAGKVAMLLFLPVKRCRTKQERRQAEQVFELGAGRSGTKGLVQASIWCIQSGNRPAGSATEWPAGKRL